MQSSHSRTPSGEVVARRRRMQRRKAQRRLSRVFAVSATVLAVAVAVVPDAPLRPGTAMIDPAGHSPSRWLGRPSGQPVSPLAVQPVWRPAGEVLRRARSTSVPAIGAAMESRDTQRESLSRWHAIYSYSRRYRIKADLARRIYDAAITAGIEPELGFRLVRVESVFNPSAVSPVGAVGLTQLMLGTARAFEPKVTREQLLDPDVNLRIGFRYLRTLIRDYKGDLRLALLVYNRGPTAVQSALSMGINPANGYENLMLRGYRGRGTLD
jgi:soluble lytic murein transglycosylase-like protein